MTRLLPVALGIAVLAGGCAGPRPTDSTGTQSSLPGAQSSTPKRITAAIQSDPAVLSSKIRLLGVGIPGIDALEELMAAGLSHQDDEGGLQAQLAEAVPSIENGLWKLLPDGRMETTWRLRPGAQWHDGATITSEDLLFTTRVGQDRDVAVFRGPAYEFVERVEAPDPRTVTISWKQPYVNADMMFTHEFALPMPKHLLEKPFLEDRATFTQAPYWNEEFVAAGPYRLRQLERGSHVVLDAYDRYVLGRPKIDEIEVKFIPSGATLSANLLAGTVDITLGRSLSFDQAISVRDQWRSGTMYNGVTSYVPIYPQFINPSPAVVGDARFRRALMHGLNRQEMADTLQGGLAPVADSFMSPRDRDYKDVAASIVRYEYDPNRASQAIDALGYARGPDGGFREAGGVRLSVEIRTSQGDDLQEKATFSAADYWQRIGVAVETVLVPPQQAQGREYRATFPAFDIRRQPDGVIFLDRAHGSKTPLPENSFTGNNYARYMNPAFDALLDRFFSTIPRAERNQVLAQIVNHMTDQLIVMPLFYNVQSTLMSNRLQSVTNRTEGSPLHPWNAHEWDVR